MKLPVPAALGAAVSLLFLFPFSAAFAHPGHGTTGSGHEIAHYLGEPFHVWGAAALALAVVALVRVVRSRRRSAAPRRDS